MIYNYELIVNTLNVAALIVYLSVYRTSNLNLNFVVFYKIIYNSLPGLIDVQEEVLE